MIELPMVPGTVQVFVVVVVVVVDRDNLPDQRRRRLFFAQTAGITGRGRNIFAQMADATVLRLRGVVGGVGGVGDVWWRKGWGVIKKSRNVAELSGASWSRRRTGRAARRR